jgi:Xaa-Pro aminopeptidase
MSRVRRLLEPIAEAGIDLLLVSELVNVRYLTGYSGSNGIAVVGPNTSAFVTDFRYLTQAADEVDPSFDRHIASLDLFEAVEQLLPPGEVRLGFEDAHMSVRQHAKLREILSQRVQLVGVHGLVERLRAVKEPAEVDRIRAAAALADTAFERVVAGGLVGRTERRVAMAIDQEMRELGATRPAFETIVAAGSHGALPHAQPRDVPIGRGEMVVIDWGAQLDGYCSDCTRTLATGDFGAQTREVYQLVLEAQLAGVAAVRAGVGGREVDGVARAVIEAAEQGEHFGHGLGHGVGLDVHESPRLSQRSDDSLRPGNVVTVEPGVYLPGVLGVRIEDLVLVTESGCEILSRIPKELRVVD